MRVFLGTSVVLMLALVATRRGDAQSAYSASPSPSTVPDAAAFDAEHDPATLAAAESLRLSEPQRKLFFSNVQAVAREALTLHPSDGRAAIDSSLTVVVQETDRKMRFLRQARMLFSEMYARRANDVDRAPGTENELWRSSRNVSGLIELYRNNPNPSDSDLERAMAPSFRIPR